LIFFTRILPTDHYLENHEKDVPWHEVVEIILTTKNPKKMKDCYRIEKDGCYVLFSIKHNLLFVINAKRR